MNKITKIASKALKKLARDNSMSITNAINWAIGNENITTNEFEQITSIVRLSILKLGKSHAN